MTAHVTKLVGAPGSGKTTKLLEFAETEAEEYETTAGELLFLTFSRSARKEAANRLGAVYPHLDEDDRNKRVKTVDGAALTACLIDDVLELRDRHNLNAPGQLLIQKNNSDDAKYFNWFFQQEFPAIDYDTEQRDPIEELQTGEPTTVPPGNRLLALYDYIQSQDWPLEDYHRAPFDIELSHSKILNVLHSWEQFKGHNDLIQHTDYVKAALERGCPPPGRVLLIDEFQDLSPLQYKLYEEWRDTPDVERVYIAGDRHQAIYGFRGADAMQFRDTPADETVHHEESKRCPQAVVDAAVPVASPVPEHDVSRVRAWRNGGQFGHLEAADGDALSRLVQQRVGEHGEVYLLARTNRQTAKLAYGLRGGGVPYLDLKPNGALRRWDDPLPTLLQALRAFDAGEGLPVPVAEILLRNVEQAPARNEAKRLADDDELGSSDGPYGYQIIHEELRDWFPRANASRDIISELDVDDWQRDLLAGAIVSGAEHHPQDVRIGTIHAAKGLEAPCVLVFPAYSQRQLERFQNGAEAEERRLYYVALTRASETALVVHDYFGGQEFPPLETDAVPA